MAAEQPDTSLTISVLSTDTVHQVKRKCSKITGISVDKISINFATKKLENGSPLHRYGIASGEMSLVSLGLKDPEDSDHKDNFDVADEEKYRLYCNHGAYPVLRHSFAATTVAKPYNKSSTIYIESEEPGYPDLKFHTIRLSCESHPYNSKEDEYGGFILYGWDDGDGGVKDDWYLNGKHCKGAYLVIQGIHSPGVQRCKNSDPSPPGKVHGAVYWNVFGMGEDPCKAVGEGFSLRFGSYFWNSRTFNANSDVYHDGKKQMAVLTAECVKRILDDWKQHSACGKTYRVKELLSATED